MEPRRLIANRYSIKSVLGRGGMGEVYLAHDNSLKTDVALKRVPLELALQPRIRNALVQEARILARLSDTHIVRLFDLADTADGMFLVLEYVCGPSLDKYLDQRKTLTADEMAHVMRHVTKALTRAHGEGVVHRDLKPANFLISLQGQEQRHYQETGVFPADLLHSEIKVADFGLAKVVETSRAEASGYISGTPAYMAPEQFRGELPGPETDIYALGFVVYRCLAGHVPTGGADPMYFHLNVTPPPIAGIPDHVNAAIQKAIRKERHDRFPSASEFLEALLPPPVSKVQLNFNKDDAQAHPFQIKWKHQETEDPLEFFKKFPKLFLFMGGLSLFFLTLEFFNHRNSPNRSPTTENVMQSAPHHSSTADAPAIPLNPAPRIDSLPPVIESAKASKIGASLSPGLKQPVLQAQVQIPGNRVFGFGPDGTLFLTEDSSQIGALRDGRLLWQFKLGGDYGKFKIGADGLIWFNSYQGSGRLFCFNAAGQGGEFIDDVSKQKYLAVFNAIPDETSAVQCVSASSSKNLPGVQRLSSTGHVVWSVPLDQECRGDVNSTPDGTTVLQTENRTVYLVSPDGKVLWTYLPQCQLDSTLKLSTSGVVAALCSDGRTLMGILDGRQRFEIRSQTRLQVPFATDTGGNFYRVVPADGLEPLLIVKTDPSGRGLWRVPVDAPIWQPTNVLGPDGNLYVLMKSSDSYYALIFGENRDLSAQ